MLFVHIPPLSGKDGPFSEERLLHGAQEILRFVLAFASEQAPATTGQWSGPRSNRSRAQREGRLSDGRWTPGTLDRQAWVSALPPRPDRARQTRPTRPTTRKASAPTASCPAGGDLDQTATLQLAADQAAETGTPLFLPAGVYSTSRLTLKSGTQIEGVPGRSILRYRDGGAILQP